MPETTRSRTDSGFTLMEVLGAAVLLGIVIVAFMSLSGNWVLFEHNSSVERKAVEIAEKALREAQGNPASCGGSGWPKTEAGFTVNCHQVALSEFEKSTPYQYPAELTGTRQKSLQAIVRVNGELKVMTVTVSWGNG